MVSVGKFILVLLFINCGIIFHMKTVDLLLPHAVLSQFCKKIRVWEKTRRKHNTMLSADLGGMGQQMTFLPTSAD